jgi:hypothetical protein
LDHQSSVFILLQKGINVKGSWEVESIVDLFEILSSFVVDDSIDLEEQGFGGLFDPAMLFDSDNLTFVIAVVVNMRNCDLFASFIELFVFNIDHEQTEKFIFSFVNLNNNKVTPSFSLMKTFSIFPMNCWAITDSSLILMLDLFKSDSSDPKELMLST